MPTSKTFFANALREALAQRHLNQAQLSEFLGVDPAYVSRWLKGSSPRLGQFCKVLDRLGWDIMRAHPDYDPLNDSVDRLRQTAKGDARKKTGGKDLGKTAELLEDLSRRQKDSTTVPVKLDAEIRSEDGALVPLDKKSAPETFEVAPQLLPSHQFMGLDVTAARVSGDAMNPLFPDGALVFLRLIQKPAAVPNGFPVLIGQKRQPDDIYLRTHMRIEDADSKRVERIIGAPLAPGHDYVFSRPREANLHAAIVGVLNYPGQAAR